MAPPLSTLERGGRLGKDPPPLLSLPWAKKIPLLFFPGERREKSGREQNVPLLPKALFRLRTRRRRGGGFFTLTIFAQIIPGENPRVFALPVCLGGFFFWENLFFQFLGIFPPNRIHAYIPGSFFVKV